jgi:hypothetical protein
MSHPTRPFCVEFFQDRFSNYFPRLASNRDPPDLCLLSSWDYRSEPPVPGCLPFLIKIPVPLGWGSTLKTSFNLYYILKTTSPLLSKYSNTGANVSASEFGG